MNSHNKAPVAQIVEPEHYEAHYEPEKPDFVKKIEAFDIKNLTPEDVEFMNRVIQNVFRENFPVDSEIIDKLPDHMKLVDSKEFVRLRQETGEDASTDIDMDLGYYSLVLDKILINVPRHPTPGGLFSTMFHESLHFVSIQSGAGLHGDFCYPDVSEDELDDGIRSIVEGTTQLITQAYVMDYLGFDPQPQMLGYEPECQVAGAIWGPFSREERMQVYFGTPLEVLRVYIESVFEEDYDPDKPNGIFADCLVNIARATKRMEAALSSWREDGNPEPVEETLETIRRAVDVFVVRESESKE